MKKIFFTFSVIFSISIFGQVSKTDLAKIDKENNAIILLSGDDITKAFVDLKKDNEIHLISNIKKDYRFFGYSKPNTKSERLILFSIFTNDVKNNPFNCKLGAYYDTAGMEGMVLKYESVDGDFIKSTFISADYELTTVYFEKKWIELVK